MKSKITVNIDSELLDIVREVSDSDLDSVVQDAVAQFLGVKQIWVKTNTLESISSVPIESQVKSPIIRTDILATKRRRRPKFVLKIWDKLKGELGEEFTTEEYWNATKKGGLGYKNSARTSTILEHLKLIEEAGKIVKISEKPRKYRKLDIEELSEKKDSRPKLFEEDNREKIVDKEILA